MTVKHRARHRRKKHPLVKIKRRLRLIYLKIIRIDDPPERIARGAAIGVLMGVLPTFGIGTFLSLGLAFILRANKASAVLGSFLVNPLTSPFFWTLSAVLGSLIMREDYRTIAAMIKKTSVLNGLGWAYLVYMVGNIIISAVFTIATYYIVKRFVVRHREHKAAKRRQALERHGRLHT